MRFLHPELILEFIVPERGRTTTRPYDLPDLGVNAQPLRFMDLLLENTIKVQFRGLQITVPHPARFALQKLLISSRRKPEKRERDHSHAVRLLEVLMETGGDGLLQNTFVNLPKPWRRRIEKVLTELREEEILAVLQRT